MANESRAKEARNLQKSKKSLMVLFMHLVVIRMMRTMKAKMFI